MPQLTQAIIEAAIAGFETQKKEIDAQIAELRGMLNGTQAAPQERNGEPLPRKRRKFSAAARKRMKEAQQARWAKIRGESAPAKKKAAKTSKPKPKFSAAARKKLSVAMKKRWAANKAA